MWLIATEEFYLSLNFVRAWIIATVQTVRTTDLHFLNTVLMLAPELGELAD